MHFNYLETRLAWYPYSCGELSKSVCVPIADEHIYKLTVYLFMSHIVLELKTENNQRTCLCGKFYIICWTFAGHTCSKHQACLKQKRKDIVDKQFVTS